MWKNLCFSSTVHPTFHSLPTPKTTTAYPENGDFLFLNMPSLQKKNNPHDFVRRRSVRVNCRRKKKRRKKKNLVKRERSKETEEKFHLHSYPSQIKYTFGIHECVYIIFTQRKTFLLRLLHFLTVIFGSVSLECEWQCWR